MTKHFKKTVLDSAMKRDIHIGYVATSLNEARLAHIPVKELIPLSQIIKRECSFRFFNGGYLVLIHEIAGCKMNNENPTIIKRNGGISNDYGYDDLKYHPEILIIGRGLLVSDYCKNIAFAIMFDTSQSQKVVTVGYDETKLFISSGIQNKLNKIILDSASSTAVIFSNDSSIVQNTIENLPQIEKDNIRIVDLPKTNSLIFISSRIKTKTS